MSRQDYVFYLHTAAREPGLSRLPDGFPGGFLCVRKVNMLIRSKNIFSKVAGLIALILLYTCNVNASEQSDRAPGGSGNLRLTLDSVIREVVRRNTSVMSDHLQTRIAREGIEAEKSIYQPVLQSNLISQTSSIQNTTEDLLVRMSTNYQELSNQFDVGFNGIIPTGAQWDVKLANTQKNSSSIDRIRNYKYEYNGNLKLTVAQPLLKGFGPKATNAKIEFATIQSSIDFGKFEQKIMDLLSTTIQVYWKLYGTQKIYDLWLNSILISEKSIVDIEHRVAAGKLPETELLEAKNSLFQRKAELYSARSRLVEVQSQLYTLLNVVFPAGDGVNMFVMDEPDAGKSSFSDLEYYKQAALAKWPEYQNARRQVEKESAQVEFAANQALPQLDLVGSVGTNSMGREYDGAYQRLGDDSFLSWSVGLKFSMPFPGGGAAKRVLSIAKLRLQQAEVERDGLEKSLSNSIYSKLDAARSMQEQLRELEQGLSVRGKLLAIEREKLRMGRVSMKALLSQEEEFVNFQRRYLSGIVGFKSAVAALEISSSDILSKYGIDASGYSPLQSGPARNSTLLPWELK